MPPNSSRAPVRTPADVTRWVRDTDQRLDSDGCVTATFVVTADGRLWIADRHSEHVACAPGGDVLSAGEMTFGIRGADVEALEVTSQSLGYCPEPESWPVVEAALTQAGIDHPGAFTAKFTFRRCTACGSKNIVKDGWFECGVCGAELARAWNFDSAARD